ncbi:hypothetical protein QTJ16_005131 [Diplocarpon rosae]|uniref:A-kinase anchor protein 7-like phosphoesterase domain-containing protein n=1 Tax=Diplocarpon rosae TaxID=946125 RepID=A0AAD9WEB9_9HELO|nr:hypothetical protein QTJ16_005131 [Diplocarpon rosae]PBP21956.1 hypothetical protein BUE80_DR007246 [Diplocarpon rosae]
MPPRPPAPRLTHFLCIPLVTSSSRPQLQSTLSIFKDEVAKTSTRGIPDGIPEEAIKPLGTLHLTLGVMSLLTPERLEGVLKVLHELNLTELLSSIKPASSSPKLESSRRNSQDATQDRVPIHITLQGLRSMQETRKTSVLFAAPLDPDLRLYSFCRKLREVFCDFLVQDARPLLLHATVVNTIYVPGKRSTGGRGRKERLLLDARALVARYEEFLWMQGVRLEKVAVCRMGSKVGKSGEEEYEVAGEVEVP